MHPDDRSAIVDLTIAYCWAIDERCWDDLAAVFLPNATAVLGVPELRGLDAIVAHIRATLEPLDASQHLVANHQVLIHGGHATSRCGFQAQHVRRNAVDGRTYLVGGRYDDELVRTPDGWRISRRVLAPVWYEGNPGVLRGDRPQVAPG